MASQNGHSNGVQNGHSNGVQNGTNGVQNGKSHDETQNGTNKEVEGAGVRVILVGPQGAGKGTQGLRLAKKYNVAHISTGDLLRHEILHGTEFGLMLKHDMDINSVSHSLSQFVSDEFMAEMVETNLNKPEAKRGFVLDGFPRSIEQAKLLADILERQNAKMDAVIEFDIDHDLLIRRISGRLVHPASGRSYHAEFNPPKEPMKDDITGEPLMRRTDDTVFMFKQRLADFEKRSPAMLKYYKQQNVHARIDANKPMAEVSKQIDAIFQKEIINGNAV